MDWHFLFKVENGEVFRVCLPTNPAYREPRFHLNPTDPRGDSPTSLAEENVWKEKMSERLRLSQNGEKPLELGKVQLPPHSHLARVTAVRDKGVVEMGNSGLMLNIITPLQKFSKGGTTISDVLRQRYKDLFGRKISSECLSQTEEVYTKRKEVKITLF